MSTFLARGRSRSVEPEHPQDECGVFAIAAISNVSVDIFYALRVLQHRGQESAGIAVYNNGIKAIKGMGLAHQALKPDDIKNLKGTLGIGHVRYSTFGSSTIENAQPIVVSTTYGDIALAHNGEIVNADKIMDDLKKKGWAFITSSDSEIAVRLLANDIANTGDPVRSLKNLMGMLQGSYSMTVMIDNRIFALRDPFGVRPLCIGRTKVGYAAASESVVFDTLGGEFLRDVEPGEIVELTPGEVRPVKTGLSRGRAHCMFEWVYIARADSCIDGKLVYEVRHRIGQRLAKEQPVNADVVVPIPDSGRSHANGYSEASGIRYAEGLMKNRYVERTFIMPEQSERTTIGHAQAQPAQERPQGQEGRPRGRLDRQGHDHETDRAAREERRSEGGTCPDRLPAHQGPLLLRHRHEDEGAVRGHGQDRRGDREDAHGGQPRIHIRRGARRGDRAPRGGPLPGMPHRGISHARAGREGQVPEEAGLVRLRAPGAEVRSGTMVGPSEQPDTFLQLCHSLRLVPQSTYPIHPGDRIQEIGLARRAAVEDDA